MGQTYTYNDFLEAYKNGLSRAERIRKLPDDLYSTKPAPEKWSVKEISLHIVRFNQLYLTELRDALSEPEPPLLPENESLIEFNPGLLKGWLIKITEPPYKMKIKTVSLMHPKRLTSLNETAREELISNQNELIGQVKMMMEMRIDADRLKAKHPIFKMIPFTATEVLALMDVHQRRHFWQIDQTLEMIRTAKTA